MKKIDLGQMLTILANVGVIGGIVFLGFELRQNTSQMRAEAAYSIHQDVQSLNRDIYQDREFANLIVQGEQSYSSLDPVDQRRVQAFFFSELNLADLIRGLEEEGFSQVSFDIFDLTIEDFATQPGRREFIDATIGQQDRSYFRSDELHRTLIEQQGLP